MDDWIKPGESVTCVEKKIVKSEHPRADSDSEDTEDDNENDSSLKDEKEKIGPLEMNEAQKMDVDDIETSPKINKANNVLEMDEAMKED